VSEQLLFPDAVFTKDEKEEAQRRRNIESAGKYNKEHPDKHRAACRRYAHEHPDRTKASRKASRKKKPEHYGAMHRRIQNALCKRNRAAVIILNMRRRSAKLGIPFDLDGHKDELQKRIEANTCEITGIPLCRGEGKREFNSMSIDRIVPAKGYVYSNIRVIAWAANSALGNWGEDSISAMICAWSDRLQALKGETL